MSATREQALALIQENQSGEAHNYASEIRIVRLEFGIIPDEFRFHDEQVSLQAEGWICDYEHRENICTAHLEANGARGKCGAVML